MNAGAAIVLGRLNVDGGTVVGAEPQSVDGLAVGGLSMTRERDMDRLEKCLKAIHVCVDDRRVAGLEAINKSAQA